MTKTIYVLISSGGSYADAWQNTVAASCDKTLLEAEQARLGTEYAEHNSRREIFYEYMRQWNIDNPRPDFKRPADIPLPSIQGIKDKDAIKRIKAEAKSVKEQNQARIVSAMQPTTDWSLSRSAAEKAYFESKNWGEWSPTYFFAFNDADSWDIEEVPFLE